MGRALLLSAALALAVAGAAVAYTPIKWTNLYVKWNLYSYLARVTGHGYFKIPLSTEEARAAEWEEANQNSLTSTWCYKKDPRVCVLFDKQGTVAGMQISVPVTDVIFKDNPYDVTQHPMFFRDKIFGTDVMSVRYFLVPKETLAAGGRIRASGDEIGCGLWLQKGPDLVEVSRDAEQLDPYWTRENCVFQMGRHYYQNVSESMQCQDVEPFFLLVNNKKDALHGVGFQIFGNATILERNWFETVPLSAIKNTLPNSPDCLEDWIRDYGVISLHMYFVDRPWFIIC